MTLPIHPLKGQQLRVVRWKGSPDGQRYVEVEHPGGWVASLPVLWTDAALPCASCEKDGALLKLSPEALLELAKAVRALQTANRRARS